MATFRVPVFFLCSSFLQRVVSLTSAGVPFNGSSTTGLASDFGLVWSNSTDSHWGIKGNTRAFLVQDVSKSDWWGMKWVKFNLLGKTLTYTVDLSKVGCGTVATFYFVSINDPSASSNYCDAAQGCFELDIMEGNRMAFHSSLHTQLGGTFDGACNLNGCLSNLGRFPYSREGKRANESYGPNAFINTLEPFQVFASVDTKGRMTVNLKQHDNILHHSSSSSASNTPDPSDVNNPSTYPKPIGVPDDALEKTVKAMQTGVTLAMSIWQGGPTHDSIRGDRFHASSRRGRSTGSVPHR